MNQAWTIFCLILAAALFFGGYEVRGWKDGVANAKYDEAQQQVTIAAEQKVIGQVKTQSDISQEASKDYAKDSDNVVAVYAHVAPGVQPAPTAASDSVRSVPITPSGTCPDSSQAKSKVYKLTPQQCDQEEAKCNVLWNWANRQAAIK